MISSVIKTIPIALFCCLLAFSASAQTVVQLFSQDFESPSENPPLQLCASDLSQRSVNFLYGNDYQQIFTVETIRINGPTNFYNDSIGTGGNYCIAMLCCEAVAQLNIHVHNRATTIVT